MGTGTINLTGAPELSRCRAPFRIDATTMIPSPPSAAALKVNPQALFSTERHDGVVEAIKIRAPIRGEGLRIGCVRRDQEAELFQALLVHQIASARGGAYDFPAVHQPRLTELGLLIGPEQEARPVRFHCDLDPTLSELAPKRPRVRLPEASADSAIVVHPALESLGPGAQADRSDVLRPIAHLLEPERWWYRIGSTTAGPQLYSFDHEQQSLAAGWIPGAPPPRPLPSPWRRQLIAAEILVDPDRFGRDSELARERCARGRQELASARYTVLESVLHPYQLAAVRRFTRALVGEGYLPFGDAEWPLRYFAGNEPLTRWYHEQLLPLMIRLAGEPLRPTFTFLASYRPGAILPPHRDREECEFSVSLLVDYTPEPEDTSDWPLVVELPESGQTIPVRLGIGDLLLYRGRELLHYRDAFSQGETSTTWLLFYQPATQAAVGKPLAEKAAPPAREHQ